MSDPSALTLKQNLLRVIRHDRPQWVPNGMESVARAVEQIVQSGEWEQLADFVHPEFGLTVSIDGQFGELCDPVFAREAIPYLIGSPTLFVWGLVPDGENLDLRTFTDALSVFSVGDLRGGRKVSVHNANSRDHRLSLAGQFKSPYYVSYHKPGTGEHARFEWSQINVVFDQHTDGEWYLVALGLAYWSI